MTDSLADSRHAAALARPLARFELLLNAAVGFTWGPLLFYFFRHVVDWGRPTSLVVTLAATLACGLVGAAAPAGYFRLRGWERARVGGVYVRYLGIRVFKGWMSHGDRMNAWMRSRIPGYRVVRPTPTAAAAYAVRTVRIERAHLAWGLAALPILVYALMVEAFGFVSFWVVASAVTNVWPIFLQRYNRVRAERVAARAPNPGLQAPGGPGLLDLRASAHCREPPDLTLRHRSHPHLELCIQGEL